ncbi:Uma2 family endonuclease [Methylovulum psychrotolerans]|uniref:Putative restriction endonuclease domain-containing protein n=1 Tax=Methylovulum psychrotolerans TaxID=1704499 RepID=A0A1Z4BUI3_9GAMM|nr:Uma2 family endonuclease [Methylovulum psychrotolerans]ASF44918.1 hypothetical protein CEK71_01895 [Methylovulum psychrotolerans]
MGALVHITEQDYLLWEAENGRKHEYIDGDCYAMAGAGEKHNCIALNIAIVLRIAARGGGCGVFVSDMKCRLEEGKFYYYPDVMLVCNKADQAEFYKEHPGFIAEVQSQSTARIDRHEKWRVYAQIPSLHYYLLADSQQKAAQYFWRDETGAWQHSLLTEKQTLNITCGDYHAALRLADIYEDVVF